MERARRLILPLFAVVTFLLLWLSPGRASAYPWMVRHDYTNCTPCHTDPSGGGLLNVYGRAQSSILLSTNYKGGAVEDPGAFPNFAFGVVPLPDSLDLQGWVRPAYIWSGANDNLRQKNSLLMRADFGAHVNIKGFRASATVGYANERSAPYSQQAWVTSNNEGGNFVSREHWVGVDLADQTILIRGGRIALPFGQRTLEHNSFTRSETRTDYNQHQQHGIAVAYNNGTIRAEVMGILGNYQVKPDGYRERGYSGYFEYALTPHNTIGVSSLVTYAKTDLGLQTGNLRMAHGPFARVTVAKPLVLLGEFDLVGNKPKNDSSRFGYAGYLQADVETLQGLHVMLTGETLRQAIDDPTTQYGGWFSVWWFALPHVDVRFDAIRRFFMDDARSTNQTYLVQFHFYL